MTAVKLALLQPTDAHWPTRLGERLGASAPRVLQAIGPVALLAVRRTALFCSARTPGDAILRAHDTARRLRDDGVTVISGFHSPIEKDCLRILLRGKQPIIVCPARAMEGMRIPTECRAAFEAGRLLFLSPFTERPRRVTQGSALRRNEVVAALADEVFIAHITPGGRTELMVRDAQTLGSPVDPERMRVARQRLVPRPLTGNALALVGFTAMGQPRAGGVNPMHGSVKTGLLIVGYGSRDALANTEFEALVAEYREARPGYEIAHAYVELARPALPEGLAGLARRCREVVVLPLFLFAAGHVKNDLPLALPARRGGRPVE